MLNKNKKFNKNYQQSYQFFFLLDTFDNKLIFNHKDSFFFSTLKSNFFKNSLGFNFRLGKYNYKFFQNQKGFKSFFFTILCKNNFFLKYTPGVKIWSLAQTEDKILFINSLGLVFECDKDALDADYTYGSVEEITYELFQETYNKVILSRTKKLKLKRYYRFSYINYFKKRRKLTKQTQIFLTTRFNLKEYPQHRVEKILYHKQHMKTLNKAPHSILKRKKEILLGLKKVFTKNFFK